MKDEPTKKNDPERNVDNKDATVERDWVTYNRAFLLGAISTNINHVLANQKAARTITPSEEAELRGVFHGALERVMDELLTTAPDRFSCELTRQEQGDVAKEISEQAMRVAKNMILARRI